MKIDIPEAVETQSGDVLLIARAAIQVVAGHAKMDQRDMPVSPSAQRRLLAQWGITARKHTVGRSTGQRSHWRYSLADVEGAVERVARAYKEECERRASEEAAKLERERERERQAALPLGATDELADIRRMLGAIMRHLGVRT
jgi:hypothetical protein